ncbi:AbrB/MazE/SpoVT family DNA-binding domain-containing protein [Thiohalorhabdus sp. Cl-TMA]|uniref:AbrB/MazE/SpoVT family DNA-binding domain-containing protein n=1 Tax=Thiohalorhabdus methylotrophus TaxID=3242694 RepID=A0ABV4TV47_9GAMM
MDAIISSKGQITLPKVLRDQLHLTTGDRVTFLMEEDGSIRLIPKQVSIKDLKGSLPKPERPVSIEEMERAIEQGGSGQ